MKHGFRNNGSVILITVFVIALLSMLVIGILQMDTEEIQLVQNQIYATEALCVAEAGLNDAFAELSSNPDWDAGFRHKSFSGGTYTVDVSGSLPNLTIESTGTTAQGFVARVETDVTVDEYSTPCVVRIDKLRINE